MYGLEITIDQKDLELLYYLNRKLLFTKPPGHLPEVTESKWETWLVWGRVNPTAKVKIYWEPKYRMYFSPNGPNWYREIAEEDCSFTGVDVYDQTVLYTLTDYYCLVSSPMTQFTGQPGEYYACNRSGQSPVTLGMAQAVDFTGNKHYRYLPVDSVQLLNRDMAVFSPYNRLTVCLCKDDRQKSRSAGISSPPIHLDYTGKMDGTIFHLKYNAVLNRFEQF